MRKEEPRSLRHHWLLRMQALDEVDKSTGRRVLDGSALAELYGASGKEHTAAKTEGPYFPPKGSSLFSSRDLAKYPRCM